MKLSIKKSYSELTINGIGKMRLLTEPKVSSSADRCNWSYVVQRAVPNLQCE